MATVVLDSPFQVPVRRLGRLVAAVVGSSIFALGLLSVVPFVVLTIIGLAELSGSEDKGRSDALPSALTDHVFRNWVLVAAFILIGMPVGLRLVRGRRELVLFLRHFRDPEATRAVSAAVARIGASWRVVTLDDAEVVPMGVEPSVLSFVTGLRRIARVVKRVWVVGVRVYEVAMVGGAVAAAAIVAITYLRDEDVGALFESVSSDPGPATSLSEAFRVILVGLCVGAALAVVFVVGVLVYLLLAPVVMWVASMFGAVQNAERSKTAAVRNAGDVSMIPHVARRWRRKVFSPQLFVVTVDSSMWQETVEALAAVSAVPLIDVSEPTENLLWEIETLKARCGSRCVFVGDSALLGPYTGHEPAPSPGSVTERAGALIGDDTILAYGPDDDDARRFARALRPMLRDHARRRAGSVPDERVLHERDAHTEHQHDDASRQ